MCIMRNHAEVSRIFDIKIDVICPLHLHELYEVLFYIYKLSCDLHNQYILIFLPEWTQNFDLDLLGPKAVKI